MTGTVIIADLSIDCIVGILPHERVAEQPLWLDVELDLDFGPAAQSESVAFTVDYAAVSMALIDHIRHKQYQLVETLAVDCCQLILAAHPRVTRVKITVKKPAAVPAARYVGVVFEQRRSAP